MSVMWGRNGRERMLVCLDLQRGSLGPHRAPDRCIVNCRRVLAHARDEAWQVAHVHSKKADPALARPIAGLEPLTTEPVFYRTGVSAFSCRPFRKLVAETTAELVIIGYSMASSCLATALVAYDNDHAVTMVEDALCAASLEPETRDALDVLTRQIARPFMGLTSTDTLVGAPRLLRAV